MPASPGQHHAARSADVADPGQHAAARNALVRVRVVAQPARQGREFQPGRARIQDAGQALTGKQLATLVEKRLGARRGADRTLLDAAKFSHQREHASRRAANSAPVVSMRDSMTGTASALLQCPGQAGQVESR
jgi:hypothetical protein